MWNWLFGSRKGTSVSGAKQTSPQTKSELSGAVTPSHNLKAKMPMGDGRTTCQNCGERFESVPVLGLLFWPCPKCGRNLCQKCCGTTQRKSSGGGIVSFSISWAGAKCPVCDASSSEEHAVDHRASTATTKTVGGKESSILRLVDPAHPARRQLDLAAKIVHQNVTVELRGERTAMVARADELAKSLPLLDEAIAACPNDADLLVAKASIVNALSAQSNASKEVLDLALTRDPNHFEARTWRDHSENWQHALRFPSWDDRESSLHDVMAAHLRLGHRVQIVRDGLQKAVAVVAEIGGPPLDTRTKVKLHWLLSETPYGPLVAYYCRIEEPTGEPSTTEGFLPILAPSYSPIEGYSLFQQLAFTPYCFVVFVDGSSVALNRKIILSDSAIAKVRQMASQLASAKKYLPIEDFQSAMDWHTNHCSMGQLTYE